MVCCFIHTEPNIKIDALSESARIEKQKKGIRAERLLGSTLHAAETADSSRLFHDVIIFHNRHQLTISHKMGDWQNGKFPPHFTIAQVIHQ